MNPATQITASACDIVEAMNSFGYVLGALALLACIGFAMFGYMWHEVWEFQRDQQDRESAFLEQNEQRFVRDGGLL